MLLLKGVCIIYFAKSFQVRDKYNIDIERLVAVLNSFAGKLSKSLRYTCCMCKIKVLRVAGKRS